MSVNVKQNGELTKVGGLYKESKPMSVAEYYSEEEHKVGVWVDGKPLYQRIFDLGSDLVVSYSSFTDTSIDASNMETIVKVIGIYSTGATIYNLMANINNNIIRLQTDRNGANANVRYITLQYTKTTDNATGGVYAPIIPMQMASKYSTDEKVVGQWTDGKPLYQKTITLSSIDITTSSSGMYYYAMTTADYISNAELILGKTEMSYVLTGGQTRILEDIEQQGATTILWSKISRPSVDAVVTLQYTKTTDTAGTGLYSDDEATLGMLGDVDLENLADGDIIKYNGTSGKFENVAKEVYSTEEQVIGTWVDGSTLYRKTLFIDKSDLTSQGSNNYKYSVALSYNRIIGFENVIQYDNSFANMPSGTTNSNYANYINSIDATGVLFTLGQSMYPILNDIVVTIKYTKASS